MHPSYHWGRTLSSFLWHLQYILSETTFINLTWGLVKTLAFSWNDLFTLSRRAAAAKSLQSCPTLCDPIDGSPPGSPVPGILQARTLEWVAISFSRAWKWKVKVKSLSRARLLATPWTAAHQAPPSWAFPGKRTGVGRHCLLHSRRGWVSIPG